MSEGERLLPHFSFGGKKLKGPSMAGKTSQLRQSCGQPPRINFQGRAHWSCLAGEAHWSCLAGEAHWSCLAGEAHWLCLVGEAYSLRVLRQGHWWCLGKALCLGRS
jgi:hypothetical protein